MTRASGVASLASVVASMIGTAAVLAAACGGHEERAHRAGSAAPVELVAQPVYADDAGVGTTRVVTDEIEPDDTDDSAQALALPGAIHGKLDPGDSDVDRYRIDVPRAGQLRVFVADLDAPATLEIDDPAGAVVARDDRPGTRARIGVPNVGVTPGRYVAVVRGRPRAKSAHPPPHKRGVPETAPPVPAVAYTIAADLVAPEVNGEREPDVGCGRRRDNLDGYGDA